MIDRIYHTWDEWECYPAGFYEPKPPDKSLTDENCRNMYHDFLQDLPRFETGLQGVLRDWPNSCEHYLTNERMNRIAWLGQAAMCHETRVPAKYCGGFNRLTEDEQLAANEMALKYLNIWMETHGEEQLTLETAKSKTEANLY